MFKHTELINTEYMDKTLQAYTSCICGYHHYQSIWIPELGEPLLCEREPTNARYAAVSVVKDDIIIGYLSR